MSQIIKTLTSGGPIPPNIPTTFNADTGSATPAANILNVLATDSSENDVDGLNTIASGNTVTVQLTNRVTGTASTVGATTDTTIMSFTPPLIAGIYKLNILVVAYDAINFTGATYELEGAVNADGAGGLATLGSPIRDMDGNPAFNVTQVDVGVGGGVINVTADGLAGRTIRWTGLMTYIFGGA